MVILVLKMQSAMKWIRCDETQNRAERGTSLQPGHAVEVDCARVDEHRARKYLQTLAKVDDSFKLLDLRTATNPNGGRRRVFVVRPDANGDGALAESEVAK